MSPAKGFDEIKILFWQIFQLMFRNLVETRLNLDISYLAMDFEVRRNGYWMIVMILGREENLSHSVVL